MCPSLGFKHYVANFILSLIDFSVHFWILLKQILAIIIFQLNIPVCISKNKNTF